MRAHLPLAGEVAITSGDAHDEGVEGGERVGVDDRVVGLRGRVHLREDFLRQSLRNSSGRKSTTATRPGPNTHW
jgi:hypothetical protein